MNNIVDLMNEKDREKTRGQFDIEKAVEGLAHFWTTYTNQAGYENYTLDTFLDDALYGIGRNLSDDFEFAGGYANFLTLLEPHIRMQISKREPTND